jgi:hypothetical protein
VEQLVLVGAIEPRLKPHDEQFHANMTRWMDELLLVVTDSGHFPFVEQPERKA